MMNEKLQERAVAAAKRFLLEHGYVAVEEIGGYVFGEVDGVAECFKVGAKPIMGSLTEVDEEPVKFDASEYDKLHQAAGEYVVYPKPVNLSAMTMLVLADNQRAYMRLEHTPKAIYAIPDDEKVLATA